MIVNDTIKLFVLHPRIFALIAPIHKSKCGKFHFFYIRIEHFRVVTEVIFYLYIYIYEIYNIYIYEKPSVDHIYIYIYLKPSVIHHVSSSEQIYGCFFLSPNIIIYIKMPFL